jgi:hypothetical protein
MPLIVGGQGRGCVVECLSTDSDAMIQWLRVAGRVLRCSSWTIQAFISTCRADDVVL